MDITDKSISLSERLRHLFDEVRCESGDYGPLIQEVRELEEGDNLIEDEIRERSRHGSDCAIHQPGDHTCTCGASPVNLTRSDTFTLGPLDAAVIYRDKGGEEVVIQNMDDDDAIVSENAMKAMQSVFLFRVPRALALVNQMLERLRK